MSELVLLVSLIILGIIAIIYNQNPAKKPVLALSTVNRINRLWEISQKSLQQNNFIQAEKSLLTILIFDPQNVATYNRLGILYAKQKAYKDAIECFSAAVNIEQNVSLMHNLGLVYFNLKQYEQARTALKQALKLDDQSAVRYVDYAKVLDKLGRNKEMFAILEKATQLEPKPEILKILLKIYEEKEMDQKADDIRLRLNNQIKPEYQQENLQRPDNAVLY
ncbi:MAG: tetratricopeptide repeat protein [Candidatus Saccharibacteria bacterium]|nr:tetratricopeptide repeat protein [Candidatus Saccharibacteria bacterium]MCY4010615.1 tetratricopeptide repeat protein [Candidatus Saccharibacteria bacterium]MCY4089078.1 tetratricopeptide repeat protein [Candidatus Saccharibacteria bacterium]